MEFPSSSTFLIRILVGSFVTVYENLAVELVSVADTLNTCDQAEEDV